MKSIQRTPFNQELKDVHKSYGLYVWYYCKEGCSGPKEEITPRAPDFYGISHLIEGKGFYWNEETNTRCSFSPGQGVISTPGYVQCYGGDGANYVEDAVCFRGPVADQLFETGIIQNAIINIGTSRRLLPIIELCSDPSRDSQIKANLALQTLLIDLYMENKSSIKSTNRPVIERLIRLMQQDCSKWWTIPEMAEVCHLSVRQFREVFTKHTGHKPKYYLDMLKMQKASDYLLHSNYSVAEISRLVGYDDPYHFSRRFKEIKEISPKHYRRDYRLS